MCTLDLQKICILTANYYKDRHCLMSLLMNINYEKRFFSPVIINKQIVEQNCYADGQMLLLFYADGLMLLLY